MNTIGQIILLVNGSWMGATYGLLPCNGQSYSVFDYPALWVALGSPVGEGSSTFKVPNLPLPDGLKEPAGYFIVAKGMMPPASDSVPPFGRVDQYAFALTADTTPANFVPCDGREYPSHSEYPSSPVYWISLNTVDAYNAYGVKDGNYVAPNVPTEAVPSLGVPNGGFCMAMPGADDPVAVGIENLLGQLILLPTPFKPWEIAVGIQLTAHITSSSGSLLEIPVAVPCNGELLSLNNTHFVYQALAGMLGGLYGGNGTDKFAVPKVSPPIGLEHHSYFIVCTPGRFPANSDD